MIKEKFEGIVLGAALGDAAGKAVEEITKEEVYEYYGGPIRDLVEPHPSSPAYGQKPEETTDETTIFKLLLESLVSKKALDVNDFVKRLLVWYEKEHTHRYPDPTLLRALDIIARGESPTYWGVNSTSVEGALRSVAMGMFHFYDPALAVQGAKVVSLITHRSQQVVDGAALISSAISLLLNDYELSTLNDKVKFVNDLKTFLSDPKSNKPFERVQDLLLKGADLEEAIVSLGNGSFVFEALPLALFVFLRYLENPEEAFWNAVNSYGEFGGDTDSIAFLVGSFLGAYYGRMVFPQDMIKKLENSRELLDLANKLCEMVAQEYEV